MLALAGNDQTTGDYPFRMTEDHKVHQNSVMGHSSPLYRHPRISFLTVSEMLIREIYIYIFKKTYHTFP